MAGPFVVVLLHCAILTRMSTSALERENTRDRSACSTVRRLSSQPLAIAESAFPMASSIALSAAVDMGRRAEKAEGQGTQTGMHKRILIDVMFKAIHQMDRADTHHSARALATPRPEFS